MRIKFNKVFYIIVALIAVTSIVNVSLYYKEKNRLLENEKRFCIQRAKEAADKIDARVRDIQKSLKNITNLLNTTSATESSIEEAEELLKKLLLNNDLIYSAGIAFENRDDEQVQSIDGPFFRENSTGNGIIESRFGDKYRDVDTEDKSLEWYRKCTIKKPDYQGASIFGASSEKMVIPFSSCIVKSGKKNGAVVVCVSMSRLETLINSYDFGANGFGALVTNEGYYIVHPKKSYVLGGRRIDKVCEREDINGRVQWFKNRDLVKQGVFDHISRTTGLKSWFVFDQIPSAGWSLQVTYILKNILFSYADKDTGKEAGGKRSYVYTGYALAQYQIRMVVLTILVTFVLVLFLYIFVKRFSGEESAKSILGGAVLVALVMLLAVGVIWNLIANSYYNRLVEESILFNIATRENKISVFKDRYRKVFRKDPSKLLFVPTGLKINSINIKNKSVLKMYGVVWQKFPLKFNGSSEALKDVLNGNLEFTNAGSSKIIDSRLEDCRDHKLKVSHFEIEMSSAINMKEYPLDFEKISIDMRPFYNRMKDSGIILVPDLEAYNVTAPPRLPGIGAGFMLPSWDLVSSYYSAGTRELSTNYGGRNNVLRDFHPTLSFNFLMKRNFLDAFVANLTPLVIVLIFLFTGFLIFNSGELSSDKERKGDLSKIVSFNSGLMLVVVFTHIGIRKDVVAESIFLLEYFYLIIYALFFYVTIITILRTCGIDRFGLQYKNGLIYKALFWPLFSGSVLLMSVFLYI